MQKIKVYRNGYRRRSSTSKNRKKYRSDRFVMCTVSSLRAQ